MDIEDMKTIRLSHHVSSPEGLPLGRMKKNLGFASDAKLSFGSHLRDILDKLKTRLAVLGRVSRTEWGIGQERCVVRGRH